MFRDQDLREEGVVNAAIIKSMLLGLKVPGLGLREVENLVISQAMDEDQMVDYYKFINSVFDAGTLS